MALAWHIMMRLRKDAVIAPSVSSRQTLSRIFLSKGREFGLVAYCAADTHIHSMCMTRRANAGEFARRVEISLQYHLDLHTGFAEAHLRDVRDQHHLQRAFHYILEQRERHNLPLDPFHDGSSLPNLVGLRFGLGDLKGRVRDRIPRLDLGGLGDRYGVANPRDTHFRLEDLPASVQSATLSTMDENPRTTLIKAAAAQALGTQFSREEVCEALKISARQVSRLRQRPVPAPLVTALRNQLSLRAAIYASKEGQKAA